MKQQTAPLWEQLYQYSRQKPDRFHVPGHQDGQFLDPQAETVFHPVMSIDATEIPGLDNLHSPCGVILEAQKLAAEFFGADHTYFLVNGSTVGNLASILTICRPGDLLLVDRFAHQSVLHGLQLAGAKAVFISPQWDEQMVTYGGISTDAIAAALQRYPQAKGVLLTYPDYYGRGIDLQPIIRQVHHAGLPIIIDQAHGAHYSLHPGLPQSACRMGADIVIQSTHKMLSAMTMGAMLHVQGRRIDTSQLGRHLKMLQSSSPSYPIMASLDLARREMAVSGTKLIENGLAVVQAFRKLAASIYGVELNQENAQAIHMKSQDPFKISIQLAGYSGYLLQSELAERNCYIEMAAPQKILAVFSPFTEHSAMHRLGEALNSIASACRSTTLDINSLKETADLKLDMISEPVGYERTEKRTGKAVLLTDAIGKQAAETVVPYPPGIPLLFHQEKISSAHIRRIRQLQESRTQILGLPCQHGQIWVYAEPEDK